MNCNFFGFSEKPFNVTPDPKFLYLTSAHREILDTLSYGIRERRGFITIIGEAGIGKTTLLNALSKKLEENIKMAIIYNTDLTFKQMLIMAVAELGLIESKNNLSKMEAIHLLNDFAIKQLAKGGNVALIVDEAQNLNRNSFENFRLLSNLETPKHKLVQIVLCGQPELDAMLSRPNLRQLSQRISLRRYVTPFNENETYDYIAHRLAIANYKSRQLFSPDALKLIWDYSKGVPRMINFICENALLIGYALEKKTIEEGIVKEAIRDLSYSPFAESFDNRAFIFHLEQE